MTNSKYLNYVFQIGIVFLFAIVIFHFAIFVSNRLPLLFPHSDHLLFGILGAMGTLFLLAFATHFLGGKLHKVHIFSKKDAVALGLGASIYLIPALVILAFATISGWVLVSSALPAAKILINILAVFALVFISEALSEEIIFRGYIFSRIAKIWNNTWGIIALQAALFLLFAFFIGAVNSPLDASFLFTFGFVLGMCRAVYGSVWASMGFHLVMMGFQQIFATKWEIFAVNNAHSLQTFILGMFPVSAAAAYLYFKIAHPMGVNNIRLKF